MAFDGKPPPPSADDRFAVADGRLIYWKPTEGGGSVPVELTNFDARIIEDQVYDDGATIVRRYLLKGKIKDGPALPPEVVPANKFVGSTWVDEHWGAKAIVHTGSGTRMLCEALKTLSADMPERRIYGHTGWRRINNEWLYLHGDGAIGPRGPVPDVSVELEGILGDYRLPLVPTNADLKKAVRASLQLVKLNAPVAAVVYRAPLIEFCPIDFSLFDVGATGSLKSALHACGQAHWGPTWTGIHLPADWSGTLIRSNEFRSSSRMRCSSSTTSRRTDPIARLVQATHKPSRSSGLPAIAPGAVV